MAPNPLFGLGLCGGALGLELGLEIALPGYRTVAAVEWETAVAGRIAARVREGSIPPLAIWSDVTSFDGRPWRGRIHIITAGFPCQPFSVAGKRQGTADDRWIWPDIARIIGEVFAAPEPGEVQVVYLENVPGLLGDPDSDADPFGKLGNGADDALGGFSTVLRDLAELGYDAESVCIRASDVGASHGRKRVFILAYRAGPMADREGADGRGELPTQGAGRGRTGLAGSRGTMVDAECTERRPGFDPRGSSEPGRNGTGEASGRSRDGNPILGAGDGASPMGNPERSRQDTFQPTGGEWDTTRQSGGQMGDSGGKGLPGAEHAPGLGAGQGNEGAAIGEPSELLENAFRPGERGQDGEARRGGRRGIFEASHTLGDAARRGLRVVREPSGSVRQPDRANLPLVPTERVGLYTCGYCGGTYDAYEDAAGRLPSIPCRWCGSQSAESITYDRDHGGTGDPGALEHPGELLDGGAGPSDGGNLEQAPERPEGQGEGEIFRPASCAGRNLPLFAFGPTDPRWADVLVQFPWLRPALAQAEIEPYFRNLADGLAAMVADERTGALRALGNGVVPLQAALGFIILAHRAGIVILNYLADTHL